MNIEQLTAAWGELYRAYGYQSYSMSKFEEYELYLEHKNFLSDPQLITFNDQNGKLLALKPDVTLSIGKNARKNGPGRERLYYVENVYRFSRQSRSYEEITEPVIKIVFADTEIPQIEALAKMLNAHPLAERFDFIRSEKTLYEILPKGVSKGALLQKLAELLQIDTKRTIAVGDYNNDISMIRTAGIGYAVANAVPEAKAVADRITVGNNDHAIAAIIRELDQGL